MISNVNWYKLWDILHFWKLGLFPSYGPGFVAVSGVNFCRYIVGREPESSGLRSFDRFKSFLKANSVGKIVLVESYLFSTPHSLIVINTEELADRLNVVLGDPYEKCLEYERTHGLNGKPLKKAMSPLEPMALQATMEAKIVSSENQLLLFSA